MTGTAQVNRDSVDAITSRLPLVLGLIAAIMFVLLFLLTGSIVMPLKALVLNVLSLTATFGAMVWIFQDGHLGALGTTPAERWSPTCRCLFIIFFFFYLFITKNRGARFAERLTRLIRTTNNGSTAALATVGARSGGLSC